MAEYEQVEDSLIRRMARRIGIGLSMANPALPYRASLALTDGADPDYAPPGHPYCFIAEAATPEVAISHVLDMIELWLRDPLDPHLERHTPLVVRRAPRRPGLPASPGVSPR
jgi:hypothetical protein